MADSRIEERQSGQSEEVIIDCVALFYEEGKGGENYRKKNKFRCRVSKEAKQIIKLKETVCEQAGIRGIAKSLGLGTNLQVELNRETKKDRRTERISNRDQLSVRTGVAFYIIWKGQTKTCNLSTKNCFHPKIIIKDKADTPSKILPSTSSAHSSASHDLNDEDEAKLNEENCEKGKAANCSGATHIKWLRRMENW
ncbi:Hypothetical predicted protein [Paramuricea clavata]|uniref:Uncharacterized protein n=1 Tax=Paramuricea clavata TaxID=317549 RepID=A0A6S7KY57_PARCT|nr:Hypothetical predicted protein [Paramuricea clavata]